MTILQEVFAEDGEIANLIAQDMNAWEASESTRLNVKTQCEKLRAAAGFK